MNIKEAIKSIADEGKIISEMAQRSLDNKDYMKFANYIYDQCREGNEETLKKHHGSTVIETIIEYRKNIILSSNPSAHHLIVINKMLKDCLSKYKR